MMATICKKTGKAVLLFECENCEERNNCQSLNSFGKKEEEKEPQVQEKVKNNLEEIVKKEVKKHEKKEIEKNSVVSMNFVNM